MAQRKALVTGASEGIGRALASRLALRGYAVTAVARNVERLDTLVASIGGAPHRALPADLSAAEGIRSVCDEVLAGGYDLLVNDAGAGATGPLREMDHEQVEGLRRLNSDAVLALSHAFLSRAHPGCALVNVASVVGLVPWPGMAVYSAAKAFVASLSQALWQEERERGVYVMALCPGSTATAFHARAGKAREPPRVLMQTADEVADEALHALEARREPVVVTGRMNRALALGLRTVSRRRAVSLAARLGAHTRGR
jgi:short-subunit dehydrogenase